jgi:hypothetical protein
MVLVPNAAFNLDKVPEKSRNGRELPDIFSEGFGRSSARKVKGRKMLRKDRDRSHRCMEFASAADAARSSFRPAASGFNSPPVSSSYQVCTWVMLRWR